MSAQEILNTYSPLPLVLSKIVMNSLLPLQKQFFTTLLDYYTSTYWHVFETATHFKITTISCIR